MHRCAVFCVRDTKCNFSGRNHLRWHRNVTCEVGYTVTGLGGDERIQTIECMESGQFSTWKQCKQVSYGVPARVVSADIQVCAECEVHYDGSVPYTCSTGHTLDASLEGSSAFTAKCESTGSFSAVKISTAIVCVAPPRAGRTVLLLNLIWAKGVLQVSLWLLGDRDAKWRQRF